MGAETTDSANTYHTITNSNGQFFLPDIWSRAKDGTQNRATESQLYFERQDPNEKIMDIINKDGYLGIESVFKEGEYVVALVKTGDKENGFPIKLCAEANLFHGAGKGKGRALDSYPYYQAEV
ncbi:hypothetical protein M408DRAFT_10010 [Serendipita vermifera MAFF 305830]|uniref:Uncharacterized protein n=1 Tax=Serendipita vermifera MAFF 305830 TaxID=933852 RepID=A0A0C2XAE2_SERVB|nr:hypothetical protein M408DRAFT_10010 [Serendipita vermifera MAFF 305830]